VKNPEQQASDHGHNQLAGRDIRYTNHNGYTADDVKKLLALRLFGKILVISGAVVGLFCAVGCLTVLVNSIASVNAMPATFGSTAFLLHFCGPILPSGAPAGAVYLLGLIAGFWLRKLGSPVAKAVSREGKIYNHAVVAIALIISSVVGFEKLGAGMSAEALVPRFTAPSTIEPFRTPSATGADNPVVEQPASSHRNSGAPGGQPRVPMKSVQQACHPAAIKLTPTSGPVGATVTVMGRCYRPSETVVVRFHTTVIAQPVADANGGFVATGTVPRSYADFSGNQFDISGTGKESIQSDHEPFDLS
jgi:hypothetical protein